MHTKYSSRYSRTYQTTPRCMDMHSQYIVSTRNFPLTLKNNNTPTSNEKCPAPAPTRNLLKSYHRYQLRSHRKILLRQCHFFSNRKRHAYTGGCLHMCRPKLFVSLRSLLIVVLTCCSSTSNALSSPSRPYSRQSNIRMGKSSLFVT